MIILGVRPNPEPLYSLRYRNAKRTVVETHPDGIVLPVSDHPEMERRVSRIFPKQSIVATRQSLNV
jgi:hypothetical protein